MAERIPSDKQMEKMTRDQLGEMWLGLDQGQREKLMRRERRRLAEKQEIVAQLEQELALIRQAKGVNING
jgi:hypothetical protein